MVQSQYRQIIQPNSKSTDVVWHQSTVSRQEWRERNGHKPVLWFTGLSGSGKSTIANAVDKLLYIGCQTYVLMVTRFAMI